MKEALRSYIKDQVTSPNEEEINDVLSLFEEKQFKKGEFFKEPFKTGNHIAFLSKGAVRLIIYKENGDEITGLFFSLVFILYHQKFSFIVARLMYNRTRTYD